MVEATCADACGGVAPSYTCYCDDACTTYGDCCDDYEAECAQPAIEEEIYQEGMEIPGVLQLAVWGDVDGDFAFSKNDIHLLSAALVDNSFENLACPQAAEVNQDGELNADDLQRMQDTWNDLGNPLDWAPPLRQISNLRCDTPFPIYADVHAAPGGVAPIILGTGLSTSTVWVDHLQGSGWVSAIGKNAFEVAMPATAITDIGLGLWTPYGLYALDILLQDKMGGGKEEVGGGFTPDTTTKHEWSDCPQRDKGCCVLIMDLHAESENGNMAPKLKEMAKKFKDKGECAVQSFFGEDHNVRSKPTKATFRYRVNPGGWWPLQTIVVNTVAQNVSDWQDDMIAATAAMDAAFAEHSACVAPGREQAIEIIKAHGTAAEDGGCGAWMTGPDLEYGMLNPSRQGKLAEWYQRANKNTCSWGTSDFSCFSANTVYLHDNLNNGKGQICDPVSPAANHGAHAGWESDWAVATGSWYTWYWNTNNDVNVLDQALDDALSINVNMGTTVIPGAFNGGGYDDSGYRPDTQGNHVCTPDPHR